MTEFLDKKTYVKQAETVIGKLNRKRDNSGEIAVSSSQLRNLLTLTNELYNAVLHDKNDKLSEDVQSRAQYIKMKIAYSAGRDRNVKNFVECSNIMDYIDMIGDSRNRLMTVCHYMEALVAYHKFLSEE